MSWKQLVKLLIFFFLDYRETIEKISPGDIVGASSSSGDTTDRDIVLPRDFNPITSLLQFETIFNFTQKTDFQSPIKSFKQRFKARVHQRQVEDMLNFGCLVLEMFLPTAFHDVTLHERIKISRSILENEEHNIPRFICDLCDLLLGKTPGSVDFNNWLGNDDSAYDNITNCGLPPPSAHQLLQPLLLPLPSYLPQVYNIIKQQEQWHNLEQQLNILQ